MTPSNDGQVLSGESAERDPRVDPRPGDVLVYDGGSVPKITVIGVDSTAVSWSSLGIPDACCDIESWRRWARNTTVITRGA